MKLATAGLNATSVVLSIIAFACFVIGGIGYSNYRQLIESLPWMYTTDGGDKAYFGLHHAFFSLDGQHALVIDYGPNCGGAFCVKCNNDGKSALGLLAGATLFTILVIAICASHARHMTTGQQIESFVFSLLAVATSVVGIALFMGDCRDAVDHGVSGKLRWGLGSILPTIGLLVMAVVAVLQLVACIIICRSTHRLPLSSTAVQGAPVSRGDTAHTRYPSAVAHPTTGTRAPATMV
jgi:hypothetical protein